MIKNKKTSRPSKEVRIAAILQSAREIFEEEGYEKAKVADIAARIGVVEGTVFHYFGSKQVLVIKVMEHFYHQITEQLREGLKGIKGTRNRLYFITWFHLNVFIKNARLCSVILNESRRGVLGDLGDDIRQFNRNYTSFLYQLIKDGIEKGEFRKDTSNALVRTMIYGSVEHTMWIHIREKEVVDIDQKAEELTDLVFRGISTQTKDLEEDEVVSLVKKLNRLIEN